MSKKLGLALLVAVAMSLSLVSVAFANGDDRDGHDEQGKHFKAELNPLNRSGAEGHAILEKEGKKKLETEIHSHGLAPKLPHAQHIHGFKQAVSECPTLAASGDDNLITTVEGQPSYGPIQVSLTTRGDTSPNSALAVDRFPVANAKGSVHYERTFTVPADVAKNLYVRELVTLAEGERAVHQRADHAVVTLAELAALLDHGLLSEHPTSVERTLSGGLPHLPAS